MNTNVYSAECLAGMHSACVTENACACRCHIQDEDGEDIQLDPDLDFVSDVPEEFPGGW